MTSGWRQNGTHGHMISRTVAPRVLLPAGPCICSLAPHRLPLHCWLRPPQPHRQSLPGALIQRGTQGSDLGLLSQGSISRALCRDKVTISVLLPLSYCLKKKKKLKRKKKDKEIEGERRARMLRFCHRRCQPATWPPQGHPQPDHRRCSREAFLCLPPPQTTQRATPLSS